jgi:hypothetical protein
MLKAPEAAMGGGVKGALDNMTRNGSIDRIEIVKEEIRGEGAKVYFKLHFKDGSTVEQEESLILRDRAWKMTIE